jgi:SET domain
VPSLLNSLRTLILVQASRRPVEFATFTPDFLSLCVGKHFNICKSWNAFCNILNLEEFLTGLKIRRASERDTFSILTSAFSTRRDGGLVSTSSYIQSALLRCPHRLYDARMGDLSPHFLFIPSSNPKIVLIDTLCSLKAIARWKLWESNAGFTFQDSPSDSTPFSVVNVSKDKGVGMVAKHFIKAGELIFSELPILVLNTISLGADQYLNDGSMQWAALSELVPKRRDSYLALKNSFGEEVHAVPAILRSNYFGVDLSDCPNDQKNCGIMGIFPTLSRANHSCTPNAGYFFDHSTFSGQFWAHVDIQQGEEICIQYVPILTTRKERQDMLWTHFRFVCQCAACTLPPQQSERSDSRRVFLGELVRSLGMEDPSSVVTLQKLHTALNYAEKDGLRAVLPKIWKCGATLSRAVNGDVILV